MNEPLKQLATIVHQYCGMNYLMNLSSFEMKINRRLQALNLSSIPVYIHYLTNNQQEWEQLIQAITINETYFFREDKQLTIYQQKVLPVLMRQRKPIHIWSAACSTGEEPYTLAMLSAAQGITVNDAFRITATDIDSQVLATAKSGSYSKTSLAFRRIQPHWIQKYFEEEMYTYKIQPTIQQMVDFQYINLKNIQLIEQQAPCDVIFCRNVLIYFDESTIESIIRAFYKVLKPGGYLFLGHAETITHFKNIGFETLNEEGTFYYRKG